MDAFVGMCPYPMIRVQVSSELSGCASDVSGCASDVSGCVSDVSGCAEYLSGCVTIVLRMKSMTSP